MKALTEKNLIDLLPAYSDQVDTAVARLADMLQRFDSVEAFDYAVKEGFIQCTQVEINDKPGYVLFWTVDEQRRAISFAAVALTDEDQFPALVQAAEKIARLKNCRWIHFNTRRAGLVKKSAAFGFTPDTVNLVKELK